MAGEVNILSIVESRIIAWCYSDEWENNDGIVSAV